MPEDQIALTLARLEDMVRENEERLEDTNRMLRQVRRNLAISFWLRIVLYLSVVLLPFLFLKPILNTFIPATVEPGSSGNSFLGFPSPTELQKAVNAYKARNAGS